MTKRSADYWEGYHAGRLDGFAQGEKSTREYFNRVVFPLMADERGLRAILTNIWGCIGNGTTQVAREQLRAINNDLGAQIVRLLNSYAAASLPRPDLSYPTMVFEAVENFLRNKQDSGEELRLLLARGIPEFEAQLVIKRQFRPGRKRDEVMDELDARATALFDEGKKAQEVVNILEQDPKFGNVIRKWDDAENVVSVRVSRWRKLRQFDLS